MSQRKQLKAGGLPSWAIPFQVCTDYMFHVDDFMHLTEVGIGQVSSFPDLVKTFFAESQDESQRQANEDWLTEQEELAELARSEIERGFPLLRAQAVIGIWGAMESLIEDLAVAWLDTHPSVLRAPIIARIRIPFGDYEMLDHPDRLRFVVSEMQRELKANLKSGATKFEPLLQVLGLDGSVDRRVRQVLYDAQQIRNVLVHRGGVADRKFVNACPHLNYSIGEQIKLSEETLERIMNGLLMYVTTVYNRCRKLENLELLLFESDGFEGALTKTDEQTEQSSISPSS